MNRWLLRVIHLIMLSGFLLTAGIAFLFAGSIDDALERHDYARLHGELVIAEVYGASLEPEFDNELFSMNGRIGEPLFLHLRFDTRDGYSYAGRVQVDRATYERYEDASLQHRMISWVCVPPNAQDHWVLLTDAVAVEGSYRWHRNTSFVTGVVMLLLTLFSVTAAPLIEVVHRISIARVNRTPGPYGMTVQPEHAASA